MLILVLNCGGATLKFKLLQMPEELLVARGLFDRLGRPDASFTYQRPGKTDLVTPMPTADHLDGMRTLLTTLTDLDHGVLKRLEELGAVAHKLAHGGDRFTGPVTIDDDVVAALREFSPLVPLHNPPNLRGIEIMRELLPEVRQFGTFETSFHQTVPLYARIYGVPWDWHEQHHMRSFGFHSASHRYVASCMTAARVISCHLGSGTSVCAIRDGRSLDISSGLTPQSGTLMSTRPGDFDPFVVTYAQRRLGLTPEEVERVLTTESGLLGISGVSSDCRDLEAAAERGNARAQLALAAFAYRVRRFIGAFLVELGGLDTIVFTGGIGENSPRLRAEICRPLASIGLQLDDDANQARGREAVITATGSPVSAQVILTDEEVMVARDAYLRMTRPA